MGAKLESFFLSFGDDDYLAIVDAPDDVTAGSLAIAVGSSGSLRNLRTIKLITPEEDRKVLEKAKAAKGAYSPPELRTIRQEEGVAVELPSPLLPSLTS